MVSFVFASCPYLDVSAVESAVVETGVNGVFPITVSNTGPSSQLVSLNANCDVPLSCSFSGAPYSTLQPGQTKTFTFYASSEFPGGYSIPLSISTGTSANCDSKVLSLTVNSPSPSTPPSSEPFDFSFYPIANQSARPGDELVYTLNVKSNLDSKSFVRFSSAGAFSSTAFFSATDIDLPALSEKSITIKVRIPPATPSNAFSLVFNARATTTEGVQFYYSFPSNVFVYSEQLRLALQSEPTNCTLVRHGSDSAWGLRVKNEGEVNGPYSVEINANEASSKFISASPELFELKQGETQNVNVQFNPALSTVLDTYYYQFVLNYGQVPVFVKDYCVTVWGEAAFTASLQSEYTVQRSQVETLLPFSVTNNGTLKQDFAVEAYPPSKLLVQPDPKSFSLSPGQTKTVNLIVTPSLQQPLGKVNLPIVIRTPSVSKAFTVKINVVAPPEESGLEIIQESIRAYSGVETRVFLSVRNKQNAVLHDAVVTLEGIASSWYYSLKTDLPAGGVVGIPVVFTIPASQSPAAERTSAIVSTSEGKVVEKELVLFVEIPESKIDFQVQSVKVVEGEGGKQNVVVSIIVRNTGQKPVSGVQAVLPTGYAVSSTPSLVSLQPGESQEMNVEIENALNDVPLTLKAADGTESEPVVIPVTVSKQGIPWLWVAIVVMAILALIYVFFVRKQEQYA